MGEFDRAVRTYEVDTVRCPQCGATNTPEAPRTILIDIHNEAYCTKCRFEWEFKKS